MKTKRLFFIAVFIFGISSIHALEITNASLQTTASNTLLSVAIYHNDLTYYTTHQVLVEGTVVKVKICYQKTPFNAITEQTDNLVLSNLPSGTFSFLVEAYFTNEMGNCDYVDLQAQAGAADVVFPLVDAVTLGMETIDANKDFSFKLFPNPAHAEVNCAFTENLTDVRICIYDSTGKHIKKWVSSSFASNVLIDVGDLENGLYFLSVFSGERYVQTRKLVVVH